MPWPPKGLNEECSQKALSTLRRRQFNIKKCPNTGQPCSPEALNPSKPHRLSVIRPQKKSQHVTIVISKCTIITRRSKSWNSFVNNAKKDAISPRSTLSSTSVQTMLSFGTPRTHSTSMTFPQRRVLLNSIRCPRWLTTSKTRYWATTCPRNLATRS